MGISLRRRAQARAVDGERLRSLLEHVRLHPSQKAVAVAGDRVPRLIIGIVALVVAVRIGGMRAARHARDGADAPTRQDHRVGAALPEILDDLLDRHERAFRRQHHLFLHPTMPSMSTLPAWSALSAWITATSGRIAGTAASRSPVNGQVTCLMLRFTFGRSTPI